MESGRERFFSRFVPPLVQAAGLVGISQAVSFARWNRLETPTENHNDLAMLVAILGVGLFLAGFLFHLLFDRLRKAEIRLQDVEDRAFEARKRSAA